MMRSLELADLLADAQDEAAAFRAFERTIQSLGFASVDYASGPLNRWPLSSNLDWRIERYQATFGWMDEYIGTDFRLYDRTVPFAVRQVQPWLYWDLWSRPIDHPVQRELEANVQSRVSSGLAVPLHGPGPQFAGIHLGSELSQREMEKLNREIRAEVFLLSAEFHAHMSARSSAASGEPPLTFREREVLTWAAAGKTAWEISVILSLSESTVKKHLSSAADKLNARTRTQAVAEALARGVIKP